ncbi:hypothetical protein SD457_22275 [Coprobacillaceae bacterium CR2/5/TPMF4]|nr:hypothetical protein SD457_22275 [Coprobacillaceae bacterium CR2/5/TPMF4]
MDLSLIDIEQKNVETAEFDKNMILYGPPGTGKTYNTVIYAVAICEGLSLKEVSSQPYDRVLDRYNKLKRMEELHLLHSISLMDMRNLSRVLNQS